MSKKFYLVLCGLYIFASAIIGYFENRVAGFISAAAVAALGCWLGYGLACFLKDH